MALFQRCTDTIHYTIAKNGFTGLFNYIHDLILIGLPSKISDLFTFYKLFAELGSDISQKKLVPPATPVVCLGKLINTLECTISIPDQKLGRIVNMCKY